MRFSNNQLLILVLGLSCLLRGQTAQGKQHPNEMDLLKHSDASIQRTTAPNERRIRLSDLTDGDATTFATAQAQKGTPLDIIFGFDDQVVTASRLVVHSCDDEVIDRAASVEVLVSNLSQHTGFRSLRTCRLSGTDSQEFRFVPTGARWLMLRVQPADNADAVTLSDISIMGHPGRPTTTYAFDQSPAKSLEVISRLEQLVDISITADEASLFEDAKDGQFDEWTFAEAALIASGATTSSKRKSYLQRLARLTRDANRAMDSRKSAFAQGEQLLSFLHAGPLSSGYVSDQTDLTRLLDTKTYNCVSSATLYNILGRRLDLDLRAIEVPDHAFSILYDATRHADVEVTTEGGFNPSRDPEVLQRFTEQTGMSYIADLHPEQRREIGEPGLVGIIYYNHGVMHSKSKQFDDALVRYFCALSLDSEFSSAVKNALSALANWGVELADKQEFDEALAVVNTGLELAPNDATLLNNRLAIWYEYIETAIDEGGSDQALALIRRASRQVPGDEFRSMQSWVFLRPAERFVDQSDWKRALVTAQSGIEKVNAEAKQELLQWRNGLFLRWSNSHLKNREFALALDVIENGLRVEPDEPRLINNIGYIVQEWSKQLVADNKPAEAEAMLTARLERHENADLHRIASGFVSRRIRQLLAANNFESALNTLHRCQSFLNQPEDFKSLQHHVYDQWSAHHARQQNWEQAIATYAAGLSQLPGDSHLLHNRKVAFQQWARSQMSEGNWLEAASILQQAKEVDPDFELEKRIAYLTQESTREILRRDGAATAEKHLKTMVERFPVKPVRRVAAGHFQNVAESLLDEQKFAEAMLTVQRGEQLLPDDTALRSVAHRIFDEQSQRLAEKGEWRQAVDVYGQALLQYPNDSHLLHNAVVTWNAWANIHLEAEQWQQAIEIYERGLESFPNASLLKNNLAYSQQQNSSE